MKVRILVVLKTAGYFGVFHPERERERERGGGGTREEIELRDLFPARSSRLSICNVSIGSNPSNPLTV